MNDKKYIVLYICSVLLTITSLTACKTNSREYKFYNERCNISGDGYTAAVIWVVPNKPYNDIDTFYKDLIAEHTKINGTIDEITIYLFDTENDKKDNIYHTKKFNKNQINEIAAADIMN